MDSLLLWSYSYGIQFVDYLLNVQGLSQTAAGCVIVALLAVFWHFMELASPIFVRAITGKAAYEGFSAKQRVDLGSRFCSFLHAVSITPIATYCYFYDTPILDDLFYGTSHASLLMVTATAGFFTWDISICLRQYSLFGPQMILHALCGLIPYVYLTLWGYFYWFGAGQMMTETSTIFLNLRYLLIALKKTEGNAFTIVNVLFAVTFFIWRIPGAIYLQILWWPRYFEATDMHWGHMLVMVSGSWALLGLNIFWFKGIGRSMLISLGLIRKPISKKKAA